MKDNLNYVIEKIARSNFNTKSKKSAFQILSYLNSLSIDLNVKKVFTKPISTIKSFFDDIKNIFYNFFPIFFNYYDNFNDKPISRSFIDSPEQRIDYLIEETHQIPKKELCFSISSLKNINFKGTLKQRKNKEVYLDIENNFVDFLYPNISNSKTKKANNTTAIKIISKEEYINLDVFKIKELDNSFLFQIKDLYSIKPDNLSEYDRIWFLEIKAKDLNNFRYKYHLPEKLKGHNFFIVIAFLPSYKIKRTYPLMKINPSFQVA